MAIQAGDYTSEQIKQFGLNPDETTSTQNIGGVTYRLADNKRGGRVVSLVNSAPSPQTSSTSNFSFGGSSSPSSPSSGSFDDTIKRAIELNRQAVQPSVQSLESSIPEVGKRYENQRGQLEAEKKPLQDRYQNLLNQIKGNQKVAENRQTVSTNNELARRGILPSSGLAEQSLTDALNPITSEYTGRIQDVGLSQESDLRGLMNQIVGLTDKQTEEERNIRNTIASILSGAGQSGVSQGIGNYQFETNAALERQRAEEARRQAEIQAQLERERLAQSDRQFNTQQSFSSQQSVLENALRQAQIRNIESETAARNKSSTASPLDYFNVQGATSGSKPSITPQPLNSGYQTVQRMTIGGQPVYGPYR